MTRLTHHPVYRRNLPLVIDRNHGSPFSITTATQGMCHHQRVLRPLTPNEFRDEFREAVRSLLPLFRYRLYVAFLTPPPGHELAVSHHARRGGVCRYWYRGVMTI